MSGERFTTLVLGLLLAFSLTACKKEHAAEVKDDVSPDTQASERKGTLEYLRAGKWHDDRGNREEAKRLFGKACDADNMAGCVLLGLLAEKDGNDAEAKLLYKLACDGKYETGCNELARITAKEQTPREEFRAVEGRCSVLFPGPPEEETETTDTPGGPVETHSFSVNRVDAAYLVMYVDRRVPVGGEVTPDAILDAVRDGALANVGGKLLEERPIKFEGHPGRELKAEAGPGTTILRFRMILVGRRLYMTLVTTSRKRAHSEDVERFLDSFKLLEPGRPGLSASHPVSGTGSRPLLP